MNIITLETSPRTELGKGPSKRLRRDGKIPAVVYGRGSTPRTLSVSPKALKSVLNSEHGRNSVLRLSFKDEETVTVMVREFSYHPVSRELTHVDFFLVDLQQPVDATVPFSVVGKSQGITKGGALRLIYRSLPIRCVPEAIPVRLEHDITTLDINEAVKCSQLKLPEGVSVRLPPEQTIMNIMAPEKKEEAPVEDPKAAKKKK